MRAAQRSSTVFKKARNSESPVRSISSSSTLLARSASTTEGSIERNVSTEGSIQRNASVEYEMTSLDRRPTSPEILSRSMKIVSVNVMSLRTLIEKKRNELISFVNRELPDVLCLQEVKLQSQHIPTFRSILPGYRDFWNLPIDKKGYSGVAVFIRDNSSNLATTEKKQSTIGQFFSAKRKLNDDDENENELEQLAPNPNPINYSEISHSTGINIPKHDQEGRVITIEFDLFYLVNAYVPNSGMDLARLDYRTLEWDVDFSNYIKSLQLIKPVVLVGDLNVAHLNDDIYDITVRHIPKQAGCTLKERNSFSECFFGANCNLRDSFRSLHPNANNIFSYWSVRSSAYVPNRGLRLDYCLTSSCMIPGTCNYLAPKWTNFTKINAMPHPEPNYPEFDDLPVPAVHDSLILRKDSFWHGDHCPVAVIIKLR